MAVEGLGNVGMELCRLGREAGATLFVSDTDARKVANAGGVLSVGEPNMPFDRQAVYDRVAAIPKTLLEVFELADQLDIPTSAAADTLAEQRFT